MPALPHVGGLCTRQKIISLQAMRATLLACAAATSSAGFRSSMEASHKDGLRRPALPFIVGSTSKLWQLYPVIA